MRKYSIENYPKDVEKCFSFLINECGFQLKEFKERQFSYLHVYEKDEIRIELNFDIMDNFFYYSVISGKDTAYNDLNKENITSFYEIAEKTTSCVDLNGLQPNDEQYLIALSSNAEILKAYFKMGAYDKVKV